MPSVENTIGLARTPARRRGGGPRGIHCVFKSDDGTLHGMRRNLQEGCGLDAPPATVLDGVLQRELSCGWKLAININPSDGHIHGWEHGSNWDNLEPWEGSEDTALEMDYKSVDAYQMEANKIMIVVHGPDDARMVAWKMWQFTNSTTLLDAFTSGGIKTGGELASGGEEIEQCPIMSFNGPLAFSVDHFNGPSNTDDGCRIEVDGSYGGGDMPSGLGSTIVICAHGNVDCTYAMDVSAANKALWNQAIGSDVAGGSGALAQCGECPVHNYAIYISGRASRPPFYQA
jgi:hypothetical protein